MSQVIKTLIVIFVLILLILAGCSSPGQDGQVVASVNGWPIYRAEYEQRLQEAEEYYESSGTIDFDVPEKTPDGQRLAEAVLEQMIEVELFVQEAQARGYQVSSEELEQLISALQQEYPDQQTFEADVKEEYGSMDNFESIWRVNLLRDKVAESLSEGINVSEEEIAEYYKENQDQYARVRVQRILVKTKEQAEQVVKRVEAGEDFADLARELSLDRSSAEQGGDMGWIDHTSMVRAMADVALTEPLGQLSVVEADYGFEVFTVLERKMSGLPELRAEIYQTLVSEKNTEAFAGFLAEAKEKARIEKSL